MTHGIAKGSRRIPDSPESAGFFEATKNTLASYFAISGKQMERLRSTTQRREPATK
jgi:hypothetical protein